MNDPTTTKTAAVQAIIEAGTTTESAYRNPELFAREIVEKGLIEGPVGSVKVMAQRVVDRLRPRLVAVASDFHVPFHNVRLVENWIQMVADIQPDVVVVNGDFLDCESISRFPKPPGGPSLQAEVDQGIEILSAIADAAPNAERHLTEGNHEERLERFILENQGVGSLRCLRIPELLECEDLGFKWYAYEHPVEFGKLSVIHGHYARKHSAYSAKAHLLDGGYDTVVHGHTHRLGAYWVTGAKGIKRGFELGGLYDYAQAEYVRGVKNWQNGFALCYVFEDDVHVDLIEAGRDGKFIAQGKVYR